MKKIILIGIVGLLFFGACQKPTEEIDRIDLEPEFKFGITEQYSEITQNRIGFLRVVLNMEINCHKAYFESNISIGKDAISYNLDAISKPNICRDTIISPQEEVPLFNLEQRKYDLILKISDVYVIHGVLENNENYLSLEIPAQFGEEEYRQTIYKVPALYIWGRLSFKNSKNLKQIDEFIDHLYERFPASSLADGRYTPFTIKNGNIILNVSEYPTITQFHRSFLVKVDNQRDVSEITEKIKTFKSQSDSEIYLEAYSWDGRVL